METNRREFLRLFGTVGVGIVSFQSLTCLKRPLKKNVLFINVDDLRPQMGCYTNSLSLHGQALIKTPHMDSLANDGVLFERAYCSVPVCAASRLSLLTGSRPYKEPGKPWGRQWAYYSRLDNEAQSEPAAINHPGKSITMPRHFKNNRYKTLSIGKVYHDIRDDDAAWDDKLKLPQQTWRGIPAYEIGEGEKDDTYYVDGRTTDYVLKKMDELKNEKFFYCVGYARPHLPFSCPKKYWDLYPEEKIELPPNYTPAKNAPPSSMHNFGELRNYSEVEYMDESKEYVSDEYAKKLIRGYYACTSYVDAQIGRLIDKLKNTRDDQGVALYDKTTIILIGDHGWNLAEHNLWCKHANYNTSIQSPLIIRDPEIGGGKRCSALVEYVDLYPTFCDLIGLGRPVPSTDNDGSLFDLHGTSLVPLMKKPKQEWKQAVFSRYHFGDTIRTDRYTYTEYVDKEDMIVGQMLYDHVKDPHENYNIADLNPKLVAALSVLLGKGPVGKRNAWRSLVDESHQNTPITTALNLPQPIYPENNYPGNGQGR
ncbi:sulfatase [candidate division KSB1 bacterium]|nr:sulfatase [candidate division KSB1 bacterium]